MSAQVTRNAVLVVTVIYPAADYWWRDHPRRLIARAREEHTAHAKEEG